MVHDCSFAHAFPLLPVPKTKFVPVITVVTFAVKVLLFGTSAAVIVGALLVSSVKDIPVSPDEVRVPLAGADCVAGVR